MASHRIMIMKGRKKKKSRRQEQNNRTFRLCCAQAKLFVKGPWQRIKFIKFTKCLRLRFLKIIESYRYLIVVQFIASKGKAYLLLRHAIFRSPVQPTQIGYGSHAGYAKVWRCLISLEGPLTFVLMFYPFSVVKFVSVHFQRFSEFDIEMSITFWILGWGYLYSKALSKRVSAQWFFL